MSTQGGNAVETVLRKLLLPVGALTGVVVVSGFFFPWIVGSVVSGQGWLVVSLLFFISALTYLSLLPLDTDAVEAESDPSSGAPYLLRVRRFSVRETLRQFLSRQDPVIFGVPVLVFAAFFLLQLFAPSATGGAVSTVQRVILTRFDWLFLGAIFLAVAYCLFLLVGPWGEIRLGGPEAEPSYTDVLRAVLRRRDRRRHRVLGSSGGVVPLPVTAAVGRRCAGVERRGRRRAVVLAVPLGLLRVERLPRDRPPDCLLHLPARRAASRVGDSHAVSRS
jgi:hypothetical protein